MANPNNCVSCRYKHMQGPDDTREQHCYMFADEPSDVCMQHTKPVIIDYIAITDPAEAESIKADIEWVWSRIRSICV